MELIQRGEDAQALTQALWLLPARTWSARITRPTGSDVIALELVPPTAEDGTAVHTKSGCAAVAARGAFPQPACACSLELVVSGHGTLTCTCARHGTHQLSWNTAMDVAHVLVQCSVVTQPEWDQMVVTWHARAQTGAGGDDDSRARVARWLAGQTT